MAAGELRQELSLDQWLVRQGIDLGRLGSHWWAWPLRHRIVALQHEIFARAREAKRMSVALDEAVQEAFAAERGAADPNVVKLQSKQRGTVS